jgi:hypothetical protein
MFTANNGRRISKSKSLPKWLANIQTSQMTEKEKVVIRIITIPMAVAVVITMETLLAEDAGDVEEAAAVAGEETIVSIFRVLNALIVAKKATIRLIVLVSKEDFKNLFQTSMKEMFTKKDKKAKNNSEGDDDSLDMNVFEKRMEGKQQMFVNENNDDLIIINDTNTFDYSIQNKNTLESINNNN